MEIFHKREVSDACCLEGLEEGRRQRRQKVSWVRWLNNLLLISRDVAST